MRTHLVRFSPWVYCARVNAVATAPRRPWLFPSRPVLAMVDMGLDS